MSSPFARLIGATAMLALFYWALIGRVEPGAGHATGSGAASGEPTASEVERLIRESAEAYAQERYDAALGPTEALVTRAPRQYLYLERLAIIYQKLDRRAEEAATWERYMDYAPTPRDACPAIGLAYAAAGDVEKEAAAYRRCYGGERPER